MFYFLHEFIKIFHNKYNALDKKKNANNILDFIQFISLKKKCRSFERIQINAIRYYINLTLAYSKFDHF